MRHRNMIHIVGPDAALTTRFIEGLVADSKRQSIFAVRGDRDASLERGVADWQSTHPSVVRWREAGASEVARYRFPWKNPDEGIPLLDSFSGAIAVEGDWPFTFRPDYVVWVGHVLPQGEALLQDVAPTRPTLTPEQLEERRAELETRRRWALAQQPISLAEVRDLQHELDRLSAPSTAVTTARPSRARAYGREKRWRLNDACPGIARAQLVILHATDDAARERGAAMRADLERLRRDETIFRDVIGPGSRVAVGIRTVDLNVVDKPLKSAFARVRKALAKTW